MLFPSSQHIAVTRACILEERSSVERETVVHFWCWRLVFNDSDVCVPTDLSKPLAFAYCISPEWRAPVLGGCSVTLSSPSFQAVQVVW